MNLKMIKKMTKNILKIIFLKINHKKNLIIILINKKLTIKLKKKIIHMILILMKKIMKINKLKI